MKTKFTFLLLLLSFIKSGAQTLFSENMGSPGGTVSIATNTFERSTTLTYSNGGQSNAADVRITSASSGYSGASGAGNVFFSSTAVAYGFSIENINAANYTNLSLQFGYKKESASVHAAFSVDYWNGTAWVTVANSASALFNEVATASAVWYLSKALTIPSGGQINGLKLRFVKTGSTAIRIDDVKLTGTEVLPSVITNAVSLVTSNSGVFSGNVLTTGGSSIIANGSVYSITDTNSNPTIGGAGVVTLSTSNPGAGTGSFSNTSGAVLLPNVRYTYNCFATITSGGTSYGTKNSFYTLAAVPSIATLSNPTSNSFTIALGADANSAVTTYAILETTTGNYIQANGTLGSTAFYQTTGAWGNKSILGLAPATNYSFAVQAKNGDGMVTAGGAAAMGTTLPASSSSDIVINSGSNTNSNNNINYTLYQGTTLSSTGTGSTGSSGVFGFYLRDGGAGMNDADNLGTEVTSLTLQLTNPANIRSARLFVGSSPRGVPVAINGASSITFGNLTNIIAGDNEQLAVNLRVTFNSNVTDNQQIGFTIVGATTNITGSKFASSNAGGLQSVLTGDVNRIEVTATKLAFMQQPPTTVYEGLSITPSPAIAAKDTFENLDLDFSDVVTLTSIGLLDYPKSTPAVAGIATIPFNIFDYSVGTGYYLSVTAVGMTTAISNLFAVVPSPEIEIMTVRPTDCTANECINMVINGDFEQLSPNSHAPTGIGQLDRLCEWFSASGTPDYFNADSTPESGVSIPCNANGFQTCNNNVGSGYAGIGFLTFGGQITSEIIVSELSSPLVAGQHYRLSFDVSLAEGMSSFSKTVQAYLSSTNQANTIIINNPQMLFSRTTTSTISNGWETLTFDVVSTTGGERFIYLGGIQNVVNQPNITAFVPNCNYNNLVNNPIYAASQRSYYYLDNVSLVPVDTLNLPDTVCVTESLPNLSSFLSSANTTGSFSGNGVSEPETGLFAFNASEAGVGEQSIYYSGFNYLGCPLSLSDTVEVTLPVTPEFASLQNLALCSNTVPPVLPTQSDNLISGTWAPTAIDVSVTRDYTFTPASNQCGTPLSIHIGTLGDQIVTTDDEFVHNYALNPITTASVLANDLFQGSSFSTIPSGISYAVTLIGTPPTFATGGITLNTNGSFAIAQETTPGTYTFHYLITTSCGASNQSSITITIRDYVSSSGKLQFEYCFHNNGNTTYNSTESTDIYTSLYDLVTVMGVPASPSNATIQVLTSPPPVPMTINADGTFTIVSSITTDVLPLQEYSFYYRVCSNGFCSGNILCHIVIKNSVEAIPDFVTFYTNNTGLSSINVLSNDIKWNCYNPVPASLSNVLFNQITPITGNYNISNLGIISRNSDLPVGMYYLEYTICDPTFSSNCSTSYVWISQCDPNQPFNSNNPCFYGKTSTNVHLNDLNTLLVSPNPSHGLFEIKFDVELSENRSYEIYDVLGKKVLYGDITRGVTNSFVNLENYPAGIYLLKIATGSHIVTKKLVKE